jgi:hypothetical protein
VEEEEGFLIGLASAVFPFAVVEEEDWADDFFCAWARCCSCVAKRN